jgi:hypothetical protein
LCLSLIILSSLTSSTIAQDWTQKMFSETSHDFGTVARGAKAEYKITIENIYNEEAHITACYSSCECTTGTLNARTLKTWDKAVLTVAVNTRSYYGPRDATITLKFDPPFSEVQVHVHANIRSDVVVQPESVQFGTVKLGSPAEKKVGINYAGRSDWKILRVECANPSLSGEVVETARTGNKVSYDLVATLKEKAPVGYIKDNIFLITDDKDPRAARVPIPVEAVVASPLTVQPNPLLIGVLKKGQSASKPLNVRSTAANPVAFHITAVHCDDPRFEVGLPEEAKSRHLLPVLFKGSDTEGRYTAKLRLETDLPDAAPVDVTLNVQVTP